MLEKFTARMGRRGSTLAEMMVALALLIIVTSMIVSFSAIVKNHVEKQKSQIAFLEETSQIRQALSDWLYQMDEEITVCTVSADDLTATTCGASAAFDGECLVLTHRDGALSRVETETVTGVRFVYTAIAEGNAIVRCTVTGAHNRNEMYGQTFVLTLQCGSFAE